MKKTFLDFLLELPTGTIFPGPARINGEHLYQQGACQMLTSSKAAIEILVDDPQEELQFEILIKQSEDGVKFTRNGKTTKMDAIDFAALLQAIEVLKGPQAPHSIEGKAYTREGMIKRVLAERRDKALKANYRIKYANNIYGEHELTNEKGVVYKILLRDFETETGYINNPDWQTNKLGTTKHIMYAFAQLKEDKKRFKKLSKVFPYIEIYTDPLNDYLITWHYPEPLPAAAAQLIKKYFGKQRHIAKSKEKGFFQFINEASFIPQIVIRPEVESRVKLAWDKEVLHQQEQKHTLDYSVMKATLFPYQQQGVQFATFKDAVIIADEMGLGKTIQAITIAVMKKKIFGFKRTLVVCPASLKEQWKKEIEKFSNEKAVVADGFPAERNKIYKTTDAYFVILNYETVMRDFTMLNKTGNDFIILDEAQKIKNFNTITAQSIKLLQKKHALVITGTPIENRITDLYSIVQFIDPNFLSPLWEFSYQHCYFDEKSGQKITGYYNLQGLHEKLKPILLRREKKHVLKDLPTVTEMTIPVSLHLEQEALHSNYAKGIAAILRKKFITPYDQQRLMLLLLNMRMVCDSTFLIDKETHISPKLAELENILLEKMDAVNKPVKIIIFSEWVVMLQLIGQMLHKNGIGYAMLNGKVAVKNRGALVKKFETDPDCKVFLSSEAGGSGLNLQIADTVINFELPWNPAKKNQRIGRIDRLGQRSKKLTVINFVCKNSIEQNIELGLGLKQNLFDGILSESNRIDEVDFSASGRAQFLAELQAAMNALLEPQPEQATDAEAPQDPSLQPSTEETIATIVEEETAPHETIPAATETGSTSGANEKIVQMEKVMQNGMDFLAGIYQMATGNTLGTEDKNISIDKETGEVVMRFKMRF
ncbi:MAG: DEAD/DEAH box helicase [Chitinophagaceae bacterium]